jgi:hypothetical protein
MELPRKGFDHFHLCPPESASSPIQDYFCKVISGLGGGDEEEKICHDNWVDKKQRVGE